MTVQEKVAMQAEALTRATSGQTMANWGPILEGFMAKGVHEADILPRENVFTYAAWQALGRQVRKGEHGVKVVTFVPIKTGGTGEDCDGVVDERRSHRPRTRPWSATVFHVSQTDPIAK